MSLPRTIQPDLHNCLQNISDFSFRCFRCKKRLSGSRISSCLLRQIAPYRRIIDPMGESIDRGNFKRNTVIGNRPSNLFCNLAVSTAQYIFRRIIQFFPELGNRGVAAESVFLSITIYGMFASWSVIRTTDNGYSALDLVIYQNGRRDSLRPF